jgi:hypothetical protein
MGRFDPTGPVDAAAYSVASLRWETQLGALGPSDGSRGAASNVPSALSVIRHAPLYLDLPSEIDDAFGVLENHVVRGEHLFPVALATLPFLFATLRGGTPIANRIAELIARYTAAAGTLEPQPRSRFLDLIVSHSKEIIGWLGSHDRALCAIALRVIELRTDLLAALSSADEVAPLVLLALVDLGAAPGRTVEHAHHWLASEDPAARMCAAAFLARFGDRSPELARRIAAALPPTAPATLTQLVGGLWAPTVERPVVAPKLYDAEVMFAGEKVVLVRAGSQRVALPWANAGVERGTQLQIGISIHGEPVLAMVTDANGAVRVFEFS